MNSQTPDHFTELDAPTARCEYSSCVAPVPRAPYRPPSLRQRVLSRWSIFLHKALGERRRQAFGILMYHRITDHFAGAPVPTWNVTPKRFEEQIAGLLARGFEPWPLRRILAHHRDGLPIPRRAFVVTIDDGYENNFLHAYPILKRMRVPATIFLATAYLDTEFPFPSDDWFAAGSNDVPAHDWRPLRSEQCSEMQASGLIELGAHTHTHDDFRGRPQALRDDLLLCRAELESRFGVKDPTFAFPYGTKRTGFAGGALSLAAKEAGMLCSLTTESELVLPESDPFDWGRFAAAESDTAVSLAAKLSGWYSALRTVGAAARPRQSHEPATSFQV